MTSRSKGASKIKKPTISDVATLAGVVPSTVSHVVNNTAPITEETKRKVLSAIEELNYSPNAMARALRQEKSRLIGVVLQDIASEFYAKCAASILEAARADNYVVLVCDATYDNNVIDASVRALTERRVEGFIFVGGRDDADILRYIQVSGVPIVLGDRYHEGFSSVRFDNKSTVNNIVCALYASGYRRFAYIGEPLSVQVNLAHRFEGFLEGMECCNIPTTDYTVVLDEALHKKPKTSTGFEMFCKYFQDLPREKMPQVIVTSNDMIAHGVIAAIRRSGLRVPEDIAVVGFDDISISEFFEPSLTTVSQDEKELGKSCYQSLKCLINGGKSESHILLPQKIVARESAIIPDEVLRTYTTINEIRE